ncbi:unnamed protein product [Sphagnum jensenii]|uniref:Uncharacterized protein n=1 Tax=Sphagnum jensenii TaxID=128206 RepID=A0ABP0VT10_9BRYO
MAGAASALFLLDVKGRVLISRDYRGDVTAPQAERAFAKLMEGEVLQDLRGEKFDERTTQEKGTTLTMSRKESLPFSSGGNIETKRSSLILHTGLLNISGLLQFVAFRCEVKKHMASVLYARLDSGPSTLRTMNLRAVQNSYSLPWLPFKPSRLVDSWF